MAAKILNDIDADSLLGKAPEKKVPAEGKARVETESVVTVTEVAGSNTSYLDALKFNEELVEIMVMPSADENDPSLVTLSVNGVNQYILAGEPVKVRRKFVEVLARAKGTRYRQIVKRNEGGSGDVTNRMIPRVALRHNFTVIQDANPKGAAWLRELLNDPR